MSKKQFNEKIKPRKYKVQTLFLSPEQAKRSFLNSKNPDAYFYKFYNTAYDKGYYNVARPGKEIGRKPHDSDVLLFSKNSRRNKNHMYTEIKNASGYYDNGEPYNIMYITKGKIIPGKEFPYNEEVLEEYKIKDACYLPFEKENRNFYRRLARNKAIRLRLKKKQKK